ncbi:MAG: response regulator transcription factor [Chitinophagaceae bacterium]|nr:response regulator transcription factor [Chitinophagaceae bacterium]
MAKAILLYEDNDALRKSLEELLALSDEFEVKGSYENCLQAADDVRSLQPDIILMDIDMPGMSGIEAVKKIRMFNTKVAILMLTVFDDNKHVLDAICAGASGYLLKKHVSEKLIAAIKEVLEGGAPMSPAIAKMVIHSMQQKPPGEQYNFTEREKEILNLLCKGNSYKMIAADTHLAFETIRTYIKKIYEKLHVHSATEAVSKAINERLV